MVGPEELVKEFDELSDTFNLEGFSKARQRQGNSVMKKLVAQKMCKNLYNHTCNMLKNKDEFRRGVGKKTLSRRDCDLHIL